MFGEEKLFEETVKKFIDHYQAPQQD